MDRQALCAYAITGELLLGEVGSVVMWSLPEDYLGKIASEENVFQTIDFNYLIEFRKETSNIMEAAVFLLLASIDSLSKYIREKSVIIELNFKLVSLENKSVVKEISALNPGSISWSNVCDYFSPREFHSLARKCSGKKTTHYAYSMNWPQRVHGTSYVDFEFNDGKEGAKFLDELIEPVQRGFKKFSAPMTH